MSVICWDLEDLALVARATGCSLCDLYVVHCNNVRSYNERYCESNAPAPAIELLKAFERANKLPANGALVGKALSVVELLRYNCDDRSESVDSALARIGEAAFFAARHNGPPLAWNEAEAARALAKKKADLLAAFPA